MRGIYKREKIWYIYFGYKGKRYREPAGESFQFAQNLLAKRKAEVIENYHFNITDAEKILFSKFADTYLEEYCKVKQTPGTLEHTKGYLKEFKSFFGDTYLQAITVNDVERWKTKKSEGCKVATVNRYLSCLQNLFNQAKYRWNYLRGDNPVRRGTKFPENNQRIRFLSDEERVALFKEANPFLKTVILFTINTGLRKGELQSLLWSQVDLTQKVIYLTKTKGNKSREIPINKVVYEILSELKAKNHPQPADHVFVDDNGEKYGSWRRAFDNAVKRAKINDFRFHDLRHTFASYLAMNGVDLNTIRELLGHSTYEMTQRYTHLSMTHRHKAVETLNTIHATITPQGANAKNGKRNKVLQHI